MRRSLRLRGPPRIHKPRATLRKTSEVAPAGGTQPSCSSKARSGCHSQLEPQETGPTVTWCPGQHPGTEQALGRNEGDGKGEWTSVHARCPRWLHRRAILEPDVTTRGAGCQEARGNPPCHLRNFSMIFLHFLFFSCFVSQLRIFVLRLPLGLCKMFCTYKSCFSPRLFYKPINLF